ncbi:HTTM domain-containing protein [Formosa sp. PL04]|uniref:HTTM domain-containing protein n=1 Tax=Formosa sp. PL04 TaxID=3081755 RepID=UPI002981D893|nr:HTTM domain-containing protein [Formosa sp. PL04]MDW5290339.1 HTTM domain-containing protein [Formosa sp. PL04]
MSKQIRDYLNSYTDVAPLAFYRIAFGAMMFFSVIRFAAHGWIDKFYIQPIFHFSYYGFSWVKPLGFYTYLLFIICGISAICVAIGYKYRLAIILFFLSFTYIELMDKTYYLNHYYFISMVSFVMIFLPANTICSVDAKQKNVLFRNTVPRYTIDILKVLLAIVYIYAGLFKLNTDWLLHAMPLKIWLPSKAGLPIIGALLGKIWVAYAFSWFGAIYDLGIVFFLLYKRTRLFGFLIVVVFHVLTRILFPIGIFPFVMIISSLIFFSPSFHRNVLQKIMVFFGSKTLSDQSLNSEHVAILNETTKPLAKYTPVVLGVFITIQLLLPFRYLCYPNELFWTEEGYRFSWRVMLMEKAGYAEFTVNDIETGQFKMVDNSEFLTRFQEKQMAFQPDFILQYAHFLHDYYQKKGMIDPEVKVDCHVALNGRLSQQYIDPNINLAKQYESFKPKTWILPFNHTIEGF